MTPKLIGVFFVEELGSTAYTEFTRDAAGKADKAFVVLDAGVLKRAANAWISWKESSPFTPSARVRVEGTIARPEDDDRRHALEFVLIHELAHVLGFYSDVHPLWTAAAAEVELTKFPFAAQSWVNSGERYLLKGQKPPGPIIYYRDGLGKPSAVEAARYYDWLAASPFTTLYAATNMYDDFADSVATYVHTEVYGQPFELRVVEDGKVIRRLGSCWREPRCARKRRLVEEALGLSEPLKTR